MVQCWLVAREYDDRNLVTLVYATPDGDRQLVQEKATTLLAREPATAAVDVDPERLEPVPGGKRERYREEADRMAARHDPDDEL